MKKEIEMKPRYEDMKLPKLAPITEAYRKYQFRYGALAVWNLYTWDVLIDAIFQVRKEHE
jgi:hypothetical protein